MPPEGSAAGPAAHARFGAVAPAYRDRPGVSEGTGFGATAGLRIDGHIFAMVVRDELVLKLPAARCAELIDAGRAQPFAMGGGRTMKQWIELIDVTDDAALVAEAFEFVSRAGPASARG